MWNGNSSSSSKWEWEWENKSTYNFYTHTIGLLFLRVRSFLLFLLLLLLLPRSYFYVYDMSKKPKNSLYFPVYCTTEILNIYFLIYIRKSIVQRNLSLSFSFVRKHRVRCVEWSMEWGGCANAYHLSTDFNCICKRIIRSFVWLCVGGAPDEWHHGKMENSYEKKKFITHNEKVVKTKLEGNPQCKPTKMKKENICIYSILERHTNDWLKVK